MAGTEKRKSTKQAHIEFLEKQNRYLQEEIQRLQESRESAFIGSETYSAQKKRIDYLETLVNSKFSDYAYWEGRLSEANQIIRQMKKDNEQLLKGESRYSLGLRYDQQLEQLDEQIRKLQAQVDGKDALIKFIRTSVMSYLYEGAEEKPQMDDPADSITLHVKGRPVTISEPEKREMRRLRREGYSIREISEISRASVGSVQKIVQRIKVDPDVIKEHRQMKRKKKKSTK